MLRWFLYSLTHCIKEVTKGKMCWILDLKELAYEVKTAWYRVIPCNLYQNTDPIVFALFVSLYFWLTVSKGHQGQYFWTLDLKALAYEAATAWNRRIFCKTLKLLIKLYLVLLNGSKRLSEVRYFEIKWICLPMRQIQPETG